MPVTTFDETKFSAFRREHFGSLPIPPLQLVNEAGCSGVVLLGSDESAQSVALAVGQKDSDTWQLLGIWSLPSVSDEQRTALLQTLAQKLRKRNVHCLTFSLTETDGQPSLLRPILQNSGFSKPEFDKWVFKLNIVKMPKDLFAAELSDEKRHGYEFVSFAELTRMKNCPLTEIELPPHPDVLTPFKDGNDAGLSVFMLKDSKVCGWCLERRLSFTSVSAHTFFVTENGQSGFTGGLLLRALFRRHVVHSLSAFVVFSIGKDRQSKERFIRRHLGQYIIDCRLEYETHLVLGNCVPKKTEKM